MDLLDWARNYWPYDEAEGMDKEALIQLLENWKEQGDSLFERETLVAHIAVCCWIVNPQRNKVLMCFHNQYQHWAWLGGHADGDTDLPRVALKETQEESGLETAKLVCDEPIDLSIQYVPMGYKRGKYVPAHLHINLTYLLEATEEEAIRSKPDENKDVKWIAKENVIVETKDIYSQPIYQRIMDKITERRL